MKIIRKVYRILKKVVLRVRIMVNKGFQFIKKHGIKSFIIGLKKIKRIYDRRQDTLLQKSSSKKLRYQGDVKFSIIMPVYNVQIKWLKRAIQSVENQNYVNWELCIVDDASSSIELKNYLKTIKHASIKIKFLEQNKGISEASNIAVDMAKGDFLLLMDNDDEITYDALYEFYRKLKETKADIIYSDQDIIGRNGRRRDPLYKPDWSPDLFLSQMYLGHLLGFTKSLFRQAGGFRTEYNGSQDYDLILRMLKYTASIEHIDKILYSWRDLPSSTATNPKSKPYAQIAGQKTLQDFLDTKYGAGNAQVYETDRMFVYDVRYKINKDYLVSIIIPTKDHVDLLQDAVDSIIQSTTYRNYEIIIVNNKSIEEKTYSYYEELTKKYSNISVVNADFEFNWSKLNNYGAGFAKGDIYVFLNNDIKVINSEWLTRIVEKTQRDDVGIVGGMLLYEDNTIQHAGVVVGLNGWADHIYKGMKTYYNGTPFISPLVTRNVTACTGALLAVSKNVFTSMDGFDENFQICGSDIEFCIRVNRLGLWNIYDPNIKLYHYESKSRDSYIPEIDYQLSRECYKIYNQEGDPYYNNHLDYNSVIPLVKRFNLKFVKKESDVIRSMNAMASGRKMSNDDIRIPEIVPYSFRKIDYPNSRLNLLVPSINSEHVFGGISTAILFFEKLVETTGYDARIILTDAEPNRKALKEYSNKYEFVSYYKDSLKAKQIVSYSDRHDKSIPVAEKDYFMFTGWWTAHCAQEAYEVFEKMYNIKPNPLVYFIQDFEPGFYAWSTRYLLADATYHNQYRHIAVFNSSYLKDYFKVNQYQFYKEFYFDPVLNGSLREKLITSLGQVEKKKQILVYGRPSVERNAFILLVEALKKWVNIQSDIEEWSIYSAGEQHLPVPLGKGKELCSLGKLSIDEYGDVLLESYAGISLMSSPHPSYPPLEMSVFGIKVITNTFANKNLSEFNENIISLDNLSPNNVAEILFQLCNQYERNINLTILNESYISNHEVFDFTKEIAEILNDEGESDV